jgi:hypothetical protein
MSDEPSMRLERVAALSRQCMEVGDALLSGSFDRARATADGVCQAAQAANLIAIWVEACALRAQLGESGMPLAGVGHAMVRLAEAIARDPAFGQAPGEGPMHQS